MNFHDIINKFEYEGEFTGAKPFGGGHICDTNLAGFRRGDGTSYHYTLQRINTNVFKEPQKLMENINGITRYLRSKISDQGGNPYRETLNIIPTLSGESFYKTENDEYWRAYAFIDNARTYEIIEKPEQMSKVGEGFGRFLELLSDYPAEKLHETIPDFHNTKMRFNAFLEAVERDTCNKAKGVAKEIEFVLEREKDVSVLETLMNEGKLTLRVTHNDTKFNNVLIDDITGNAISVIDLDTVMPGLILYDFGDAIRAGANPAAEDEKDLSKVCMDISLFESFTHGFLKSTRSFLNACELENLPFAAKIMTFECGIRFLADYLNGDTYFKVHREGQNLDRARTQFKMVADMENKMDLMKSIVEKYI